MSTLTESVPNWSGTLKVGKALVKLFFCSHSMDESAKVSIHATYLDLQLPSGLARPGNTCTFYPADGRGCAIPSARKVTGYIPLCCNLCGMQNESMAPCEAILRFQHDTDMQWMKNESTLPLTQQPTSDQVPSLLKLVDYAKLGSHTYETSRNPLEEWSAGHRHLPDNTQHLQEKNIHVLYTFEPAIPAIVKTQNCALDP